jgi:hypothetical protein
MVIFSLIKTNYLRNNELFKNKSTQSKGNRIVKMAKLFFTNSLTSFFCDHKAKTEINALCEDWLSNMLIVNA